MSETAKNNLIYPYAALLLSDANKVVSLENIKKVVAASNNAVNENIAKAYARALEGRNIDSFLGVSGGAAQPVADAKPQAATKGKVEEKAKPVEKVPEKEAEPEEDFEMGGMFDWYERFV